ncbi:DUF2206 domain-containing protein [Methanoculleus horonobensis]|uniref:DUF2206 domain-containing protein n=1 Tax=Methanoculleus horonobensis TaxID=528314 RepID=UPI000831AB17|nr:DUF2206 domain-containing protein [Methanoculleus horonobensis]
MSLMIRRLTDEMEDVHKTDIHIRNLISWNDWKFFDFFTTIIGIQALLLVLTAFGTVGIHVPLLRPVVGFIYCCFVPGIVLLRTLNLHHLCTADTLLYSIGLSIGIVYLLGFCINIILPLLNIASPFSTVVLTLALTSVTAILCILCWLRESGMPDKTCKWQVTKILTVPNMSLFLIPFTAIFGTVLVNNYYMNHLLLAMVVILVLIAILVGLDRYVRRESYLIAIFITSVTLLLHTALITPFLWGWDIVNENFYATAVLQHQIWDIGIFDNVNGCLSIVVLAPVLSQLTELPLTWVFKLLYPLIFSLIAVALYRVYQHQTEDRIAFFACFMFVSYFQYYSGMVFLARQMIAELFLALLLLLMLSTAITGGKRAFLMGFFGFAMITSHYGLSYLFMAALVAAWVLILIAGSRPVSAIGAWTLDRLKRTGSGLADFLDPQEKRTILTAPFVIFFSLFTVVWYSLVAGGSVLTTIMRIGNKIVSNFIGEMADPAASQGMGTIVLETASPLHEVWKYLFLITNLFIVIGLVAYLFSRPDRRRFTREYIALASVFLLLDVAAIAVPYLASALSVERFYQITIIILSPFFAYGGLTVFSAAENLLRGTLSWTMRSCHAHAMLAVFLAVFLLFNTGFIYEVTADRSTSMALSSLDDFPKYNEREMTGAQWLHLHASVEGDPRLLSDTKGELLLRLNLVDWRDMDQKETYDELISPPTNVDPLFLHSVNIKTGVVRVTVLEKATSSNRKLNVTRLTHDRSKIYSNGGSETYL